MGTTKHLHAAASKVRRAAFGPSATPAKRPPARALFPAEARIPRPDGSLGRYAVGTNRFDQIALVGMGRMIMAGLRPDHDVLDIGCGVGRMARYLCDYLRPTARYEGFDVIEEPVKWCQGHITPLFPNFNFQFTPLFNTAYSPDHALPSASQFRFPYPDESFDFVFAHSVFTHLLPDEARNYVHETARVLRRGGLSYSTWILFGDADDEHRHPHIPQMHRDASGSFALLNPDVPEKAVAYDEAFVLETCKSSGLAAVIHPAFRIQDAVVATKEP
jgi:SAM-dependent methyltransferase